MALGTIAIVALVVFLIVTVLMRRFAKAAFRVFSIIWTLLFVALIVLMIFIARDNADLEKNFGTEDKVILIDLDARLVSGVVIGDAKTKGTRVIENIDQLNQFYLLEDYDGLLGDKYKVLLFKKGAFDSVNNVEVNGLKMTRQEALSKLGSAIPSEQKALITAALFKEKAKENDVLFLFKEIKKGNLIMYPETVTIKLVNVFPEIVFMQFLKKEV